MLVRDRMVRKVITTEPQRSLAEVRALLRRHRVRQVPVLRGDRVVGIVTDRDLRSAPAAAKTVADVMTAKPFVISPDASVDEAARLMRTYKIGALPVVDGAALLGILTASDVLDAFVDLSGVAEPTYRIVLTGEPGKQFEARIRHIVEKRRGELKWLHYDAKHRPAEIHLRVKVRHVDDVESDLEAAGFEVSSVVAPPRVR